MSVESNLGVEIILGQVSQRIVGWISEKNYYIEYKITVRNMVSIFIWQD